MPTSMTDWCFSSSIRLTILTRSYSFIGSLVLLKTLWIGCIRLCWSFCITCYRYWYIRVCGFEQVSSRYCLISYTVSGVLVFRLRCFQISNVIVLNRAVKHRTMIFLSYTCPLSRHQISMSFLYVHTVLVI